MKKRSLFSVILYVGVLALVLSLILGVFNFGKDDLTYSQIVKLFREEQIKSFVVEDQTITLELHGKYDGKSKLTCKLADPDSFRQEMLPTIQEQSQSGILESYDFLPQEGFSTFDLILPLLGIPFPLEAKVFSGVIFLASMVMQFGIQLFLQPHAQVTYMKAYDALREKKQDNTVVLGNIFDM